MIIRTITTATAIEIFLCANANAHNFFACSMFPPNVFRPSFYHAHSLPCLVPLVQLQIPLFQQCV